AEYGYGIAVDSAGNAYVTGNTASSDFPTANAFAGSRNGYSDAFVTKIDASGTSLSYSTYLGGSSEDYGYGIAVDSAGNAYVTGNTASSDFPTENAFDGSFDGFYDAFVTKIGADATPTPTPSQTPQPTPSPTPEITPSPIPSPTGTPTAITLTYFHARAGKDGSVTLTWQTATEVDNAGFNLYRSESKDGAYQQINNTLIPARGNAVSGAGYSYVDTPSSSGTYYYKLEDVDYYGVSAMHGPEKARVRSDDATTKKSKRQKRK
ncbi:MAG: SBBP repeat-containing protein, partial [Candidatus Brocadia sp.]|nr:SBBP repeat-containing protein [Candidatus Brocadia sp.]